MKPDDILSALRRVKAASRKLSGLTDEQIRPVLEAIACHAENQKNRILEANLADLSRMDQSNPKYDRLLLNDQRLRAILDDIRKVADLPSPLGRELESRVLPNGLNLKKVSVPLGVIGIIYESRPNVTFDVAALCLKSGNACVLKGSRDAAESNSAIAAVIREALEPFGLHEAVWLAPSERESLPVILQATGLIDVIIPRGSQELILAVREHSRIPVIETGAGIVHTYFDQAGSLEKGKRIITNAKSRRVSVCNALDTVLIHRSRLQDLPDLLSELGEKHQCQLVCDPESFNVLRLKYAGPVQPAAPEDFGTEFLSMKLAIRTVGSLEEALDHIAEHSSGHSEAIVSEDEEICRKFMQAVDAAVVYANTTTAFTDGGEFGMGAEIGISTQKLHARGPMALNELTSYKWLVSGNGQIR